LDLHAATFRPGVSAKIRINRDKVCARTCSRIIRKHPADTKINSENISYEQAEEGRWEISVHRVCLGRYVAVILLVDTFYDTHSCCEYEIGGQTPATCALAHRIGIHIVKVMTADSNRGFAFTTVQHDEVR
jgi:hypothetical protein